MDSCNIKMFSIEALIEELMSRCDNGAIQLEKKEGDYRMVSYSKYKGDYNVFSGPEDDDEEEYTWVEEDDDEEEGV